MQKSFPRNNPQEVCMNMQAIGRKISVKRKERDMTQVDLADKLGVTYQAVSSWERGQSMPDIAKLPDISQVLAVSIDELLDNAATATLVKSVLTGQDPPALDLEALADAAPILKPSQIEALANNVVVSNSQGHDSSEGWDTSSQEPAQRNATNKALVNEKFLVDVACHLESEKIKEILLSCDDISANTIKNVACHMESEDLKEILRHREDVTIADVACHMESDDLMDIVKHCKDIDLKTISNIACFMEDDDLVSIIMNAM